MAGSENTTGFAPLLAPNAHTLILGSLPSVQSVATSQYYGNPQNAFWKIMGELFGAGQDLGYEQRVAKLIENGVSVWDVLQSCVRPGSMDAAFDMKSAVVNDFRAFLRAHTAVRRICFNGQAAQKIFRQRVTIDLPDNNRRIEYITLPSTSPAYAAMSFADKLKRWSVIKEVPDVPKHQDTI